MEEYGPATYGDRIADVYDERVQLMGLDNDAAVEFLARLSAEVRASTVLELAIGTGRIALPLKERGIDVHGIDISESMVAKLREKPGGSDIPVTMGNFADVPVEGSYKLIYLVFNTLFALLTQAEQIRCFESVMAHLDPGGVFVIECFVPDIARFDRGQRVQTTHVSLDGVDLDVSVHHPAAQRVDSQHVSIEGDSMRTYPVFLRYAWPSELDLMARLAGLSLRKRWGGWKQEPFGDDSGRHVSIYD
ncbi:MAG: methyltransferase domain-containing protein [Actinomycetota bacterium]|nr:methyltransferase domain-containing protein [Actinomycetota bacterium]